MASSPPNEPSAHADNRILANSITTDGDRSLAGGVASRNNIIWDMAQREYDKRKQDRAQRLSDRHIVLLGTRGVGKSTMLHRVSGRDDKPAESIGLEYTYVRHQLKSSLADEVVGHIWECPPTPSMPQLLKAVVNHQTIPFTSFIICVDLSQPNTIPSALDCMLKCADTVAKEAIQANSPNQKSNNNKTFTLETLKRRAMDRLHAPKAAKPAAISGDLKLITEPSLTPCWIIGCKYDKFQDYEPEKKNMITKYLRFLARLHGAGLMFFHWKSEQVTRKLKSIMMELTLPPDDTTTENNAGSSQTGTTTVNDMPPQFDFNKIVFVKPGDDDLTRIGEPTQHDGTVARGTANSESVWRRAYESFFPPAAASEFTQTKPDDVNWSQYQEPIIDQIYALKNEELGRQKLVVRQ